MLVKGLEFQTVEKLSLRDNNLKGEEAMTEFETTPCKIIELDLSENQIGREIKFLRKMMVQKGSVLKKLYLDRIGLSDEGALTLFEWVQASESLRCLSLSENKLTDYIGTGLANLISSESKLEELYLTWNNFSSMAGEPFFKALAKNEHLKVLDLGWNALGSNMKVIKKNADHFVDALCECLKSNKSLLHFSLNNNGFSYDESKKIAEVFFL